ncbi:MAG: hypothetical protein K6E54_10975, partial [Bacteroidaceae bacterium]|nr:hypothetical protein [Bacteroidaceae bacterium]
MKEGNTYAAYTPYNGNLAANVRYDAVPISLTGQDGILTTIGTTYDYMCAPSSTNDEQCASNDTHELVFDFQHTIAILQLYITMPVAATWSNITLTNTAGDNVWITGATLNVSTGAVTSTATSSSID